MKQMSRRQVLTAQEVRSGRTVVRIIFVLAMAGLLFLLVFLQVPVNAQEGGEWVVCEREGFVQVFPGLICPFGWMPA